MFVIGTGIAFAIDTAKASKLTTFIVLFGITLFAINSVSAQMPTDPLGGQPAADAKPSTDDLEYQVLYHRAFEAVLWSMPAVSIYGFQRAAVAIGGTSLVGGEGGIVGTVIGALVLTVIRNGLTILGISTFFQQIIMGAIIITVVALDMIKRDK